MTTLAEPHEVTAKRRPLGTADDVAAILNTPLSSVYEKGRRGQLPGVVRLGRSMRFDLDALEAWIAKGGGR